MATVMCCPVTFGCLMSTLTPKTLGTVADDFAEGEVVVVLPQADTSNGTAIMTANAGIFPIDNLTLCRPPFAYPKTPMLPTTSVHAGGPCASALASQIERQSE